MATKTAEVQGAALYMEFRRSGATCQIIVTPDGINSKDEVVFSKLFRRVVRPEAPKKRWAAYALTPSAQRRERAKEFLLAETGQDFSGWADYADERLRHVVDYFDSLMRSGYTLVQDKVLYVEVSKSDMDEVQQGSLSTKVWNRVKASRVAAGFPTSLADA